MTRRTKYDLIATCGLFVAIAGVWLISIPWACIIAGVGVFVLAELAGTYPRQE